MSNVTIRTVLSLGLCAFAAAPVFAEPETDRVIVRIADLNIATPAGEQALHGRVAQAIGIVCGDSDPRDLRAFSAMRACRAAAMAKALPQMQVAIADARSGRAYAADRTRSARSGF